MARQRMITRTIQTTEAKILCVNTSNAETYELTLVLSGVFKNDKQILNAVAKNLSEGHKAVHVVSATVNESLYGMAEEKFLELATELPARASTEA